MNLSLAGRALSRLILCAATAVGAAAARAEIPRGLVTKAERLMLCEIGVASDTHMTFKLPGRTFAEGADCRALLAQLAEAPEGYLPATGLGIFANVIATDAKGRPLLAMTIRAPSGITSVNRCRLRQGLAAYRAGEGDLALKHSPAFTRRVYEAVKKHDPVGFARKRTFYREIGTTLEKMLFADGVREVREKIERSKAKARRR